jgi:hypothetical protein
MVTVYMGLTSQNLTLWYRYVSRQNTQQQHKTLRICELSSTNCALISFILVFKLTMAFYAEISCRNNNTIKMFAFCQDLS